jgi:hypothetical protein
MSDTPKSDAALRRWPEFTGEVHARLDMGKRIYGDDSFERPLERLLVEIQQELMDVCGWSFIMWSRLEKMKARTTSAEDSSPLR